MQAFIAAQLSARGGRLEFAGRGRDGRGPDPRIAVTVLRGEIGPFGWI